LDIEKIVSADYKQFSPEDTVSKVKGYFENSRDKAVLVRGEVDAYEGVVTLRQLISSHLNPDAKVKSVIGHPPRIDRTEDVREVARLMVESDFKVLPVEEGKDIIGVVTAEGLLSEVNSKLSVLTVEDVHTPRLISVTPDATVGKIINIFRENGISRVPVIEGTRLVGIVTLYDILGFSVREERRDKGGGGVGEKRGSEGGEQGGFGPRHGEADRMLDIPAEDVMNSPVETADRDEPLNDATGRMLEMNHSSLVVTDGKKPTGIFTKTDVLTSLTWTDESRMDVQISNVDYLEPLSPEDVAEMLEEIADKYAEMQVLHANVHLKRHKEKMRGNPLILARVVFHTNKGKFVVKGEGYGPEHALNLARDKLEHRVLGKKGVRRSDRDAERMFKELGL